jgi:hypothetical protein
MYLSPNPESDSCIRSAALLSIIFVASVMRSGLTRSRHVYTAMAILIEKIVAQSFSMSRKVIVVHQSPVVVTTSEVPVLMAEKLRSSAHLMSVFAWHGLQVVSGVPTSDFDIRNARVTVICVLDPIPDWL